MLTDTPGDPCVDRRPLHLLCIETRDIRSAVIADALIAAVVISVAGVLLSQQGETR